MKPKLLAVELWALGDLMVATPFLRAAAQQFEVTLLAKPTAKELQPRLWPGIEVIPFNFPWTAFRGKYRLHRWPWHGLAQVTAELRRHKFDIAISARWDPRDHPLLWFSGAKRRVGFPRLGTGVLLTDRLALPAKSAHRYENWRVAGRQLGLKLPPLRDVSSTAARRGGVVLHTGAAQPTKIWPLDRYAFVVKQFRAEGYPVEIVCDASQREWWISHGEQPITPGTLTEFFAVLDRAAVFVGNDSGPGHLAGILGLPTFTFFGNQFPTLFAPLDSAAEWIEGAPCPYKPCYDSCHFARPECLLAIGENDAWQKLKVFAAKHIQKSEIS